MSGLSAHQHWIVQPLTDVGLAGDQVSRLLFRLAFDTVVSPVQLTPCRLHSLVDDQPDRVRGAWIEVLDRMTRSSPPGSAGHGTAC